jgi:large subunit ribosomal protein L3
VFPGKKMTGHLGDVNRTTQNLVDRAHRRRAQLLLIRGAVPARGTATLPSTPRSKATSDPRSRRENRRCEGR